MATGANTAPLGKLHPILAAKMAEQNSSNGTISGSKDPELKKHLEAAKRAASTLFPGSGSSEPPKKKRRSRWNTDDGKIVISGLPTVLPANMTEEEQTFYILHLKIEEHSRMLRTGDLGIPVNPGDRSPSPEPIYSHDGKRQNTREVRVRKRLEDERHEMVQKALTLKPEYKPPPDYKPPNRKFEDKVFIPQEHHPETNFVGLLIGPRGNTLKQLEKDTQTKIMIRGKGATKEGKLGRAGLPQPGEDEPLHALITGTTPELVKGAVDKIKAIIQSGIDVPGNDNDLKKLQLQQLAELNGTFKPLDVLKCRNCGSTQHKTWECSEQENITSSIVCTRCGGGGHIASDCKVDLSTVTTAPVDKAKMDSEYLSLMKELGESVPEAAQSGTAVPPPATMAASKPVSQTYMAPAAGVVPVMPPPWVPPTAASGAPPLMSGPPPFMMVPRPAPGGMMGVVSPWGMATPVPPGALGPLMPTPVAVPMAPAAYPQVSQTSSEAPTSSSCQPVPLLSASSGPAVPLSTVTQVTTSAPQPGPPAVQPPWQQPPQAQQHPQPPGPQPPQASGPHPPGSHPPHPSGQHPPQPSGPHPLQPSGPHPPQPSGPHPPQPSGPHPPQPSGPCPPGSHPPQPPGPHPPQPPGPQPAPPRQQPPQPLHPPGPPSSQPPQALQQPLSQANQLMVPHSSQTVPIHTQPSLPHASQAAPPHVQAPPPQTSQAPPPHVQQLPQQHAGQAPPPPPPHSQPHPPPPPPPHANQPPPWQHAPPPPMMYGAPPPHGMPGNAPPPPPDQSWTGAPPLPPLPPPS